MEDKTLIGSIDFSTDPILNEIKIGNIDKLKNVEVYVYSNEGPIAHVHLVGFKEEICIKIFEPEYFSHGSKQGTLNKSQAKIFDKFMRSTNKSNKDKTNWELSRDLWISYKGNNYRGPGLDTIQPDYNKLS